MTPPPSDAARATPPRTQFFGAVLWGMVAVLALAAVWLAAFKLEHQIPFVDFQVLWTGGRMTPDEAYRQAFPYPPSALLLLAPIARLGFGLAGPLWTGLTLAAFAGVSWRLLPECRRAVGLTLVVLTPGAAWAAVSGQASFLIGALVVSGTAMLERRPWLAGVALGAAAAVKPSDLVLAPVALIAGRHWRALCGAMLGGGALVATSILVFGVEPWRAWVAALSGFSSGVIQSPRYFTAIIAPAGLALQLGLSGWVSLLWRGGFAVVGVVIAAGVFRRTDQLAPRLTALIGAGFLASPYVMNYATTLLAPGAVLALMTAPAGRPRLFALAAFVALAVAGFPNVGAVAFLIFLALALGPLMAPAALGA